MNADSLARRVLIQSSPEYAQRRMNDLWELFAQDVAARPEVYESAIDNAPAADRDLLRDVLPHTIEYTQAKTPAEREQIDAKYSAVLDRVKLRLLQNDVWFRVWFDVFFADGSWQDEEFTACAVALYYKGE